MNWDYHSMDSEAWELGMDRSVYSLRLFISGAAPNSIRAVNNIRSICDQYLAGRYHLEIIDVHQRPLVAMQEQVIALPMLIKTFPTPARRLIGDMSDTAKVLTGLGLTTDYE